MVKQKRSKRPMKLSDATKLTPFEWTKHPSPNARKHAQYTQDGGYDGDEQGNEWYTGFALYPCDGVTCIPLGLSTLAVSGSPEGFDLYTDDGYGNGDFLGHVRSLDEANRKIREASHMRFLPPVG